jgi:selT/selW/selH-like putative selenoprotein
LGDELSNQFGNNVVVELKAGDRGAFEVYLDEKLIFSKLQLDRFPNDEEIVQLIINVGSWI